VKATRFTVAMTLLAIAVVALLTILAIWYWFPAKTVTTTTRSFDRPGDLPTLPVNASNPAGCGVNFTVAGLSLPSESRVYYNISVGQSGDSLNYWILGVIPPRNETTVVYAAPSTGTIVLGTNPPSIEFVLQGCGSTAFVPYLLRGTYTYGDPN